MGHPEENLCPGCTMGLFLRKLNEIKCFYFQRLMVKEEVLVFKDNLLLKFTYSKFSN